MGYVFDFQDAKRFEQWMDQRQNRSVAEKEFRLMIDLLNPLPGKTILDIGCGIGSNFFPLLSEGLQVTGLDASPYMIDIAVKKTGGRVDVHRGYAEELPFDDNTFNYACMTTTLEFVEDPKKALEEACRVTRDRIYIGILNRYAINSVQLRVKGIFTRSLYNRARFFSLWEVKRILRSILGDVPISWRTLCQMPECFGETGDKIGRSNVVRRCPFGAIVGIVASLVPRYKTTPLPLQISPKRRTGEASG
ncbi:MAG: class I SAM-dependent methyltransferase [Desulfobacteraceae bacterium]|nr:MAG: class I SAM-dependent methyltransferase [Desulfobacteraceae bacterium]